MRARDIMTARVVTATPSTPVREAVRLMLERHVSGLPVVNDAGELVGIVTEADLLLKKVEPRPPVPAMDWFGPWLWLERWVSGHRKAAGRTVGEVMTHNVITADEDTPVHALASRMLRFQVNRLPIVSGRQLVGIVTRADILRVFLRGDDALADEARRLMTWLLRPGEEVQVEARDGVIVVRGRVGTPVRRQLLLDQLWRLDGVVAVDDAELAHGFGARAGRWE